MSDERTVETMQRLYQALTPGDLDQTLERITAAAVDVLPDVEYASITILHSDGSLETAAPTHDLLLGLDAAQYQLREGPCYEAATDTSHVTAPDLATDGRFQRYAAVAVEAGIRAQAGLRLFESPKSQGALNLYSGNVGAFSDLGDLGSLFAHQAALALGYAQEIDDLHKAIQTRKTIGQAIGILMERYELTDQRAFAFLSRLSQHRNVKLSMVAQELVAEAEGKNGGADS